MTSAPEFENYPPDGGAEIGQTDGVPATLTTSTPAKITAAAFAKLADSLVGLAYVLGQAIPYNLRRGLLKALDCSGLIGWLLYWSGNGKGDRTADGWYAASIPVPPGQERVGDVVFLRNNPAMPHGIGHTAILTKRLANGDWRIIEARGHRYGVVRTTLSYWRSRKHYAGVHRFPWFSLLSDPTAPKPVSYPPTIRLGSKGKWVEALQRELNLKGAKPRLRIDAQFGNLTAKEVGDFQRAHGLVPDRVVGPKTWKALGITM